LSKIEPSKLNILKPTVYFPSLMKFHSKYPENYYTTSKEKLKQLRIQANNIVPLPLPIAKGDFYREILKRHRNKNQRYKDELEVFKSKKI
jgi:hypothetical protein